MALHALSNNHNFFADPSPPTNIQVSKIDSSLMRITLAWNQSVFHCSPTVYVVTANGGCDVFPNTTVYTNIATILYYPNMTTNGHNCTFQLQTKICEAVLGDKSDQLLVTLKGTFI